MAPHTLLPPGRAAEWNQAMMAVGATVCTARSPRCEVCPMRRWCASAGRVVATPRSAKPRQRFEDSNRWVRGQVVAALAKGVPLRASCPQEMAAALQAALNLPDVEPERLAPALAGLERDGVIIRTGGAVRLR